MSLTNGTQAQHEAQPPHRGPSLIGVGNDAWVEQRRGFERVFVQEISADQLALAIGEREVCAERLLHFIRALLEFIEQITVPALEILQDLRKLVCGCRRIKR